MGLLENISSYSRGQTPRSRQTTSNPYQGGLQTTFKDTGVPYENYGNGLLDSLSHQASEINHPSSTSNDTDVQNAQSLYNEMQEHGRGGDVGADAADLNSRYNMYLGRIGIKNSLADQISSLPGQETTQENIARLSAGQSLGQGLQNTRSNYNSRGLLYSGMRDQGENQVRGAVADQLSQNLSGAKRDTANSLAKAQSAYASVDLANQQESLQLANQAFDTANQNNIARLQAMQQLGQGVGSAAGQIYGSSYGNASNPTSNWNPQQLQMPQLGAAYATPQTNYGVLGGST